MQIVWGSFWRRSRKWVKAGWLIMAGVVALYIGAIEPQQNAREISSQRATGLDAVAWEPISLWRQARLVPHREGRSVAGVPGGLRGDEIGVVRQAAMMAYISPPQSALADRKMVRTSSIDLVVKNPAAVAEKVQQLAEHMGGFLVSSQISGGQDAVGASLTLRVPATRFEEARSEIRKLGLRVESDRMEAQDVTKDYVDKEARLRNLRAQEEQYLAILKRASTVKDTLEVSDKLNGVRGEIEQQQAEFDALSKQVETVAITVSLRAEEEAQVFGLHWRPLYQLKLAARQGLDSVGDYAASMASFLFYLPTVLLWLGTILIGAAAGWRILRWGARVLFAFPKAAAG
ncbi:MAG TPA: DUF4349 domain-containing protein [Terriglobales bacterium]|jgi:hypothetical protein|nr:DUF4349 domain-containing protein [Terriglobales bacterium]